MMVAMPELDGATGPMVFGGRSELAARRAVARHAVPPRAGRHAGGPGGQAGALRRTARAERKVAIVLFNFPPNAGNTGTAAYLGVFESLFNTLQGAGRRRLHGRGPGQRRRAAHADHRGQCRALRRPCQRPCPHPGRRPCAPRAPPARDRGAVGPGARPPAERRRLDLRARRASSATCSSACSPPSATRATRCGCCSRRASRRPTPSRPSTAICARISARMRCCISAPTGRSSSCPASRPACRPPAGRTG